MSNEIADKVEDTGITIDGSDQSEVVEQVKAATEETATSDALSDKQPSVDAEKNAVARLAFEKREEKRRADALEDELRKLKETSKPVTSEPVMPRESDFDFDSDKYSAAMAKYNSDLIENRVSKALSEREGNQSKTTEAARLQSVQDKFWKQAEKAKIPGFAESLSSLPTFDKLVLEAIMDADDGVYITDYLAKHTEVADIIASSSPIVAAMRIGEISTRLASNKKTNKVSNAPEPITTLKQSGSAIANEWDDVGKGVTIE